jgi:hypothetical protein
MAPAPRILALFGDIHGSYRRFCDELTRIGVDVRTGKVPEGLLIIQVGDLVHGGGEDQLACLRLADLLLRISPERYVQLLGNHDAHYLGGPDVSTRSPFRQLVDEGIEILCRWQASGAARLAVAISTRELGDVLVTHGGLTAGLWRELGMPATATAAASALNELLTDPARAFRPGKLMTGELNMAAGVTGPRTGAELAQSWLDEGAAPFHQVHGRESAWWWPDHAWHDDVSAQIQSLTVVDRGARRSTTRIGAHSLISIDGKLDALDADTPWHPLLLCEMAEAKGQASS